jgi:hypothetical protein
MGIYTFSEKEMPDWFKSAGITQVGKKKLA